MRVFAVSKRLVKKSPLYPTVMNVVLTFVAIPTVYWRSRLCRTVNYLNHPLTKRLYRFKTSVIRTLRISAIVYAEDGEIGIGVHVRTIRLQECLVERSCVSRRGPAAVSQGHTCRSDSSAYSYSYSATARPFEATVAGVAGMP